MENKGKLARLERNMSQLLGEIKDLEEEQEV